MNRDNLLKLGNAVYVEMAAIRMKMADQFDNTQVKQITIHLAHAEVQLLEMLEEVAGRTVSVVADA